jgi:hypothetical protein
MSAGFDLVQKSYRMRKRYLEFSLQRKRLPVDPIGIVNSGKVGRAKFQSRNGEGVGSQ